MLLLDTDSRELSVAAHGDELGHLRPEETLAMPLRRSQDYREDSRQDSGVAQPAVAVQHSPLAADRGLRPLGRLALVDHVARGDGAAEAGDREVAPADAAQLQLFRGS